MKTSNEVHAYLALRYGRYYVTKLAKRIELTKHIISRTINGQQLHRPVREKIAADSNLSVEEFFEPEFDRLAGLKADGPNLK